MSVYVGSGGYAIPPLVVIVVLLPLNVVAVPLLVASGMSPGERRRRRLRCRGSRLQRNPRTLNVVRAACLRHPLL